MTPKFGTSGLRGLVSELTAPLIDDYVAAFIAACDMGTGVYVGHDLRQSSPDIAAAIIRAARARAMQTYDCGAVPTPALALAATAAGAAAIMVTGSHIPADRNGLKFYTPAGEITKADEAAIGTRLGAGASSEPAGALATQTDVLQSYFNRYQTAFDGVLSGMRIGVYMHSAVGGQMMCDLVGSLGGIAIPLGASDTFIPIDTEAVSVDLRAELRGWASTHELAAIISTDADGDRPLLTDERGVVVPGDILGQITAVALGAQTAVTPISSNASIMQDVRIGRVITTKIGSPYVIVAMLQAAGRVVGYEANGGFLLGFSADGPTGPIPALMTRDALLPILAALNAARVSKVSTMVQQHQRRVTAADRIEDICIADAQVLIASLEHDAARRWAFLDGCDERFARLDTTDGLRMHLASGRILHLRLSGNAPELRIYVEADSEADAHALLEVGLEQLSRAL